MQIQRKDKRYYLFFKNIFEYFLKKDGSNVDSLGVPPSGSPPSGLRLRLGASHASPLQAAHAETYTPRQKISPIIGLIRFVTHGFVQPTSPYIELFFRWVRCFLT